MDANFGPPNVMRTLASAPVSATAPGNPGDVVATSDYIYVCVSLNVWRRTVAETF